MSTDAGAAAEARAKARVKANGMAAVAELFGEMAEGLETGRFGRRPRVGLTVLGSEHGPEEMVTGAELAARADGGVEVVLLSDFYYVVRKDVWDPPADMKIRVISRNLSEWLLYEATGRDDNYQSKESKPCHGRNDA